MTPGRLLLRDWATLNRVHLQLTAETRVTFLDMPVDTLLSLEPLLVHMAVPLPGQILALIYARAGAASALDHKPGKTHYLKCKCKMCKEAEVCATLVAHIEQKLVFQEHLIAYRPEIPTSMGYAKSKCPFCIGKGGDPVFDIPLALGIRVLMIKLYDRGFWTPQDLHQYLRQITRDACQFRFHFNKCNCFQCLSLRLVSRCAPQLDLLPVFRTMCVGDSTDTNISNKPGCSDFKSPGNINNRPSSLRANLGEPQLAVQAKGKVAAKAVKEESGTDSLDEDTSVEDSSDEEDKEEPAVKKQPAAKGKAADQKKVLSESEDTDSDDDSSDEEDEEEPAVKEQPAAKEKAADQKKVLSESEDTDSDEEDDDSNDSDDDSMSD